MTGAPARYIWTPGCLVTAHHLANRLDEHRVLVVVQVSGFRGVCRFAVLRLVEALQCLCVLPRRGERHGLHRHRREASIAGDEGVDVEGVGEDPLAEVRQLRRVARPRFEQILHDQLVAPAACGPRIHEARHLVQIGGLLFEVLVQRPEVREKVQVEDLGGFDRDHDDVVASELVPQLVVMDEIRVARPEEGLHRVVDLDPRQLRAHGARQRQHAGDRPPAPADHRASPPLERGPDPLANPHRPSFCLRATPPCGRREASP